MPSIDLATSRPTPAVPPERHCGANILRLHGKPVFGTSVYCAIAGAAAAACFIGQLQVVSLEATHNTAAVMASVTDFSK